MAIPVGPFQHIVGIHFPGEEESPPGYLGIIDATRTSTVAAWAFLARIMLPGLAADRWDYTTLGGVRGQFIVGKYQFGLGGDYAYASANRQDPEDPAIDAATGITPFVWPFALPSDAQFDNCYLWHCGTSGKYNTLIVNLSRILFDFTQTGDTSTLVRTQIAGNSGDATVQFRIFDNPATGEAVSFLEEADGRISCNLDLIETKTTLLGPQIVSSANIDNS